MIDRPSGVFTSIELFCLIVVVTLGLSGEAVSQSDIINTGGSVVSSDIDRTKFKMASNYRIGIHYSTYGTSSSDAYYDFLLLNEAGPDPNTSMFDIGLGFGYDLPIYNRFFLPIELSVGYGQSDIIGNVQRLIFTSGTGSDTELATLEYITESDMFLLDIGTGLGYEYEDFYLTFTGGVISFTGEGTSTENLIADGTLTGSGETELPILDISKIIGYIGTNLSLPLIGRGCGDNQREILSFDFGANMFFGDLDEIFEMNYNLTFGLNYNFRTYEPINGNIESPISPGGK